MKRQAGNPLAWWLPLLILSALSFFIQSHLYLHKDVAYLLHEAGLMLQGQTYANQIFEPNPPLILFLSMPPILFAKLTAFNVLDMMRLYVILLAIICYAISAVFIRKIFREKSLALFIAYTVAFTVLFLPAHQFAQREHLLMIFIFPYLFAASARLENIKVSKSLALVVGVMAGIGFSIKPHFLFALVFIELYFCFANRSVFGWVRLESLVIAAWMLLYAACIWLLFKSYLQKVYPLWWPFYDVLPHKLRTVLTYPSLLYCFATLIFYFILQTADRYRVVSRLFVLALFGFIITFILPRVNWYYHVLPALSIALILLAILLSQCAAKLFKPHHAKYDVAFTIIIGLFFSLPILQSTMLLADSMASFATPNSWSKLITFLKKAGPHNSFDYFSNTHALVILENYANANYVGRFPSLFWNYDLVFMKFKPSAKAKAYYETEFPVFANAIADDLTTKKPRFVIVDLDSQSEKYYGTTVNYIDELSEAAQFKKVWKQYHYLTTIDEYVVYKRK